MENNRRSYNSFPENTNRCAFKVIEEKFGTEFLEYFCDDMTNKTANKIVKELLELEERIKNCEGDLEKRIRMDNKGLKLIKFRIKYMHFIRKHKILGVFLEALFLTSSVCIGVFTVAIILMIVYS